MTARHLAALVLLVPGCAALLLSAAGLLLLRDVYDRLHALAPASSLGAPLVVLALAVDTGPGRAAVKLLFTGVLIAAGGAVTTSALGRVTALLDPDGPEEVEH
ncbi:monovalent cation/H(+) antiporter subunit G [Streptacidiphilus monticola]|jgi:multicomponent Na+:H+ antiporter subunit G|uniref:Monovalent cation/H(+) antiporter subunit G n=1 Tax=Streptacidiphilus monticola TaxID=2161674 RepID=A0ABW1G486_9ACTN